MIVGDLIVRIGSEKPDQLCQDILVIKKILGVKAEYWYRFTRDRHDSATDRFFYRNSPINTKDDRNTIDLISYKLLDDTYFSKEIIDKAKEIF